MLNMDLFKKCIELVVKCLRHAKIDKSNVDDVVLVGGSTGIPKVQQLLRDFFIGKALCKRLNPDEAVAYGAALHAAILSGIRHSQHFLLVDFTPISLGTKIASGELRVLIPRNTPIPTKMTATFTTTEDNQTHIWTKVYEGERPMAQDNHFLGEFCLDGIPPAPVGVPKIIDTFEIDENGILTVTSTEEKTKNKNQITIAKHSVNLSKAEIDSMVEEAKKYEADMEHKKLAKAKFELEQYVSNIEHTLRYCGRNMEGKDETIEDAIEWLNWNFDLNDAGKFKNKLKELQSICDPLIAESH